MKVKQVDGSNRVYIFEDGEIVPFFDKDKYKEKMKDGEEDDKRNEEKEGPKTKEPEVLVKPKRKYTKRKKSNE